MTEIDLSAATPSEKLPQGVSPEQAPKKKLSWLTSWGWKKALIGGVFVAAILAGWFGYTVFATWQAIGQKNAGAGAPALLGLIDPNQLKGEGDGRVNILIIGRDKVAGLTDTVIVASIDPETGHVAMLSLPRDLYVPIHGAGRLDKINAVFGYGEKTRYLGGGPQLLKDTVSDIIDVQIHYFVSVDFEAFKKIIDTVGGVDLVVPQSIYDSQFPRDDYRGYDPFSIKAGPHHLDGATALKYVRTRKGAGSGNDFGRAKRQQQVIEAVGSKVKSIETLLNPKKITEIIKSLGSHVRTDFQLWEIQKLIEIGQKNDGKNITSIVLTNEAGEPGNYLVSGRLGGGAYILKPKTGNFDEIAQYVHSIFVDPFIRKEAAKIELRNGSNRTGLAAQVGKLLTNYSYNVVKIAEADRKDYATSTIIVRSESKDRISYTLRLLELRFGVDHREVKYEDNPGDSGADVIIVIGASYGKK